MDRRTFGLVLTLIGLATMVAGIVVRLADPDVGAAIAVGGAFATLAGRLLRTVSRR